MSTTTTDTTDTTTDEATGEAQEPQEAAGGPDDAQGESDATEGTQDAQESAEEQDGRGNREAAKYRQRLRETEGQRDELAGRVAHLQRTIVAGIAWERLAVGDDLFDVGKVDLDTLLDDNGDVDPAAVDTAITELLGTRPGLKAPNRPRKPMPSPYQGVDSGGSSSQSWSSVVRGR